MSQQLIVRELTDIRTDISGLKTGIASLHQAIDALRQDLAILNNSYHTYIRQEAHIQYNYVNL